MKPATLVKNLSKRTCSSVRNDLSPPGFSVMVQAVGVKSGCFSLIFSIVSLPLQLFLLLFPVVLAITTLV